MIYGIGFWIVITAIAFWFVGFPILFSSSGKTPILPTVLAQRYRFRPDQRTGWSTAPKPASEQTNKRMASAMRRKPDIVKLSAKWYYDAMTASVPSMSVENYENYHSDSHRSGRLLCVDRFKER
jgi:hypothetical protein